MLLCMHESVLDVSFIFPKLSVAVVTVSSICPNSGTLSSKNSMLRRRTCRDCWNITNSYDIKYFLMGLSHLHAFQFLCCVVSGLYDPPSSLPLAKCLKHNCIHASATSTNSLHLVKRVMVLVIMVSSVSPALPPLLQSTLTQSLQSLFRCSW